MRKNFFVLAFLFILTSCAVGPLVSHETARTVGDNNHEIIGSYGEAGVAAKWNYGLTENFDFGIQWESLSAGLRAKYAFLNFSEGFSMAVAGGAGLSEGGSHYYGDLMLSYRSGFWEPYATVRIVHVDTDPEEIEDEYTWGINFKIDEMSYEYGQVIVGSRFWLSQRWLLSVEGSSLFGFNSGFDASQNYILSAALGLRL
ncbi:MAG TPA: hypothetical protein VKZ84_00010 [Bacteriovoracaceae bacterium]|nr:hypothetical protein [Bacteriovoracaceae bacterium]